MIYDVVIIGAGASGMACAVTASQKGVHVLVIEQNMRPGKKLKATGNGKCNIANSYFDPTCYRGSKRPLIDCMTGPNDYKRCIDFLTSLGLAVTDKNGYYYPASMQASAVINVLEKAMEHNGVVVCYGRQVNNVTYQNDHYVISTCRSKAYQKEVSKKSKKNRTDISDAERDMVYKAKKLVIASGGLAGPQYGCFGDGYQFAKAFGHHIVTPLPALVPLNSNDPFCKQLFGVRVFGRVALYIDGKNVAQQTGEIQFSEYGISGICVFMLSRYAVKALSLHKEVSVRLNFMPDNAKKNAYAEFEQTFCRTSYLTALDALCCMVPEKLAGVILSRAGVDVSPAAMQLDESAKIRIFSMLTDFQMQIIGYRDYDMAQVTAGGVDVGEITPEFESRLMPDLYLIGELLDIDGTCGGYNLTFAFVSGITAADALS